MKVLVAGDFCPRARGQELVESGCFDNNFIGIKDISEKVDFSIVNFETNISTPNSYPIEKNGPSLTTTENSLKLLKYLGFNVVTLANNHFYDYGEDAIDNTIKCIESAGIRHVGGGQSITEAQKTLFLRKNNETLAIINACEHEFSIANDKHGGSYGVDPIQIFYDIIEAKKRADYVLVIIHGGHEYFQLPSIRMQEWYRFFIDAGADAVINHHQHCYSGMEIYKNKPIFYGLGNFFFDKHNQKEKDIWNEGIIVNLNFTHDNISYEVIPYEQCVNHASVSLKSNDKEFIAKFQELNKIISNRNSLGRKNQEFFSASKQNVLARFQPYGGKFLMFAYLHKLLPSILSKKKILSILNMIECEAHHDRTRYVLHDYLNSDR